MKINQSARKANAIRTHEGARAKHIGVEDQLKRSVLTCMLWEKGFYEDGVEVADRIESLANQCSDKFVADLAVEARTSYKLRHAPLILLLALIRKGGKIAENAIFETINRPDEITELVALYWRNGKRPLSNAMKRGLARAFNKFDEYQLSKWNKASEVKLRDVMFLVHPRPKNAEQAIIFKKLADQEMTPPNTWESRLTAGENKRDVFTDLLKTNKLGYMALLRNLRGMTDVGVDPKLITKRISETKGVVLPYRFISAAKHAPQFEPALDSAMQKLLTDHRKLPGKTTLLVDVSASMDWGKSGRSEITHMDSACGLGILLEGICEDFEVFTFSNFVKRVPRRSGMALRDAIVNSQMHHGTDLGGAVHEMEARGYERLIVITDEQSNSRVPDPSGNAYMINVASDRNGVGYGKWKHIDGFSEACVDFIQELEAANF